MRDHRLRRQGVLVKAVYVPPRRTPAPPLEVSLAYLDALTSLTGIVPGPQAVAVLHAHGALETGHFDHCWNGNAGNIKASEDYEGFFTCITLNEKLSRGGKKIYVWFAPEGELTDSPARGGVLTGQRFTVPNGHPQTRMRAYPTLADGIADKIKFLLGPRWIGALDFAHAGDPEGYVEAIRDRGYFTADLEPYARAVSLLYRKFLPLAQGSVEHPIGLHPHEEQAIEECVGTCFRFDPRILLDPNWDAVRADRDRDVREANS